MRLDVVTKLPVVLRHDTVAHKALTEIVALVVVLSCKQLPLSIVDALNIYNPFLRVYTENLFQLVLVEDRLTI